MSEEFSLGDSDLMLSYDSPQVTMYHNYATASTWDEEYDTSYDIPINNNRVRIMMNFVSEQMRHATGEYLIGVDSAVEGGDTSAFTYSPNWYTKYDKSEEVKPVKNPFKTKEDIFISIVKLLEFQKYEINDKVTRIKIINSLLSSKKYMEEFFDDCSFICDKRNNRTPAPQLKDSDSLLILDFFFTEKDIKVKRTYRFILEKLGAIEVFDRFRKQ